MFDLNLVQNLTIVIVTLLLTAIVAWALSKLLDKWVHKAVSNSKSGLDDTLLNALKMPLISFVLLIGLWLGLQRADFVINPSGPLFSTVFFVLFLMLAYWAVFRLISGIIDWYSHEIAEHTETTFDDYVLPFFKRVLLIILTAIVIIILLGHFNVNVSALVATLGVTSIAIALAAQEVLGNMISGFIIMVDQPFRIGDRIELRELDTWGDVQDIGLHSTRILTRDHRLVSVPNALIGKSQVVNHSIPSTVFRVQTHVGVAYGTDIDHVRKVLVDSLKEEDWVMTDKPIEALFLEFQDSGLLFRVRCWIEDYVETRRVIDKMNTAIYKALNASDIEIPFPQRVVHMAKNTLTTE